MKRQERCGLMPCLMPGESSTRAVGAVRTSPRTGSGTRAEKNLPQHLECDLQPSPPGRFAKKLG